MKITITFLVFVLTTPIHTASAQTPFALTWDFNNGQSPTIGTPLSYVTSAGTPESAVFSVSGGLLHQNTYVGAGSHLYDYSGTIHPTLDLVYEARLRIDQIGSPPGGVYIQARDGVHSYRLFFSDTDITIMTTDGSVTWSHAGIDISEFHTYRVVSPANSGAMTLIVDGSAVWAGEAQAVGTNLFAFGDASLANPSAAAIADWDYVHISQGPGLADFYPGSLEDFVLHSGIGVNPVDSLPKCAVAGDLIVLNFRSLNGTFDFEPYALAGQTFTTGTPPAGPALFPDVHIDPASAFVLLPSANPFSPPVLPGLGINAAFVVPPGLSGTSLILQAFAGSSVSNPPPANGFFAASDGNEIRLQ